MACSAPAPRGDDPSSTAQPVFPEAFYRAPPHAGQVFRIDAQASHLQVRVFRDGPLARQGHNHLLLARQLSGAVFLPERDISHARVDLAIDSAAISVDPPAERAAAGAAFVAPVSAVARAGTRENMLGPDQLDAAAFPRISVQAGVAGGELPELALRTIVQVRDRSHVQLVPVRVQVDPASGTLRAEGSLVLRQSEFGIAPFRAAGGLLRVADTVIVDFVLVARTGAAQHNAR